jgi:hypothetical protein
MHDADRLRRSAAPPSCFRSPEEEPVMQIPGTAVHAYDTPTRHPAAKVQMPWGKIVAGFTAFVLVGAVVLAIFGVLVQRL